MLSHIASFLGFASSLPFFKAGVGLVLAILSAILTWATDDTIWAGAIFFMTVGLAAWAYVENKVEGGAILAAAILPGYLVMGVDTSLRLMDRGTPHVCTVLEERPVKECIDELMIRNGAKPAFGSQAAI